MPISRTLFDSRHVDSRVVILAGNFTINGTSDPDAVEFKGVSSVSRSGLGTFTIALPVKGGADVVSAAATCNDDNIRVGVAVNASTGVVTLTTYDEAGAAVADPADDSIVYLTVFLRNKSFSA